MCVYDIVIQEYVRVCTDSLIGDSSSTASNNYVNVIGKNLLEIF